MNRLVALLIFQRLARPFVHHYTDRKNAARIKKIVQLRFPQLKLNENSVICDFGLNRGRFSLAFANTNSTIIALEPNPYAFSEAVKTLSSWKNIIFLQAAIVNKPGIYKLYFHKTHQMDPVGFSISSSLQPEKVNIDVNNFHEVIGLGLDTLLADFPKIDLMKIDIEGGEIDLFESLMHNFHKIEYLLMELHEDRVPGTQNEIQKFKEFIKTKNLEQNWLLDWE